MLDALNWEPLSQRRAKNRVTMLYKIINKQVTIDPNTYLNKSDTVLEGNININKLQLQKTYILRERPFNLKEGRDYVFFSKKIF